MHLLNASCLVVTTKHHHCVSHRPLSVIPARWRPLPQSFAHDVARRELVFPCCLTAGERYRVHVMAEAWGLGHCSRGEGEGRHIVVVKERWAGRRAAGP